MTSFVGRIQLHGALCAADGRCARELFHRYDEAAWASLAACLLLAVKLHRKTESGCWDLDQLCPHLQNPCPESTDGLRNRTRSIQPPLSVACACASCEIARATCRCHPIVVGSSSCLPSPSGCSGAGMHPNHRKFFHSVAVFAGSAMACTRLYKRGNRRRLAAALRVVGLVAGAVYPRI